MELSQDDHRVLMQNRGLEPALMLELAVLNDRGAAAWGAGDVMRRQCERAASDLRRAVDLRSSLGLGRFDKPPRRVS